MISLNKDIASNYEKVESLKHNSIPIDKEIPIKFLKNEDSKITVEVDVWSIFSDFHFRS